MFELTGSVINDHTVISGTIFRLLITFYTTFPTGSTTERLKDSFLPSVFVCENYTRKRNKEKAAALRPHSHVFTLVAPATAERTKPPSP